MKRSLLVTLSLVVALLAGVAVTGYMWLDRRRATYYTDAQTIRQPAHEATLRPALWRPPVLLPNTINTLDQEYEARLSADGMTLFFVRGQPDADADLFISHRLSGNGSSQQWSSPQAFHEINSDADDLGPEPSADGNSLYFYSNRPGGAGGFDLWVSHRAEAGWQTPVNLGPTVNSQNNEHSPALSPDGSALYFASDRTRALPPDQSDPLWSATLRENLPSQDYDLYSLRIDRQPWQAPQPVAALNSPHNDGAPCFSAAGDFLYFSSDRPGGRGGFDLYRARLLRCEYQPPANLGPQINSTANDLDPSLSFDGFALHFSSDRLLESSSAEASELDYNVFFAVSREVFAERADAAGVDWASLWPTISPGLRWLLLGFLSLLLFLLLLKPAHSRRLTLLARCALVSLMAHLVLMIVLSFWQVTTELSDIILDQGKGSKVALSSYGAGDALTSQVRGGLTELASLAVQPLSGRASSSLDIEFESAPFLLPTETAPVSEADTPLVHSDRPDPRAAEQLPPLETTAQQMATTPLVAPGVPSQAPPDRSSESTPTMVSSAAEAMRSRSDGSEYAPQAEPSKSVALTPSIVKRSHPETSLSPTQPDEGTGSGPGPAPLPPSSDVSAAVSAPTPIASTATPLESAPNRTGTEPRMSPSAARVTASQATQDLGAIVASTSGTVRLEPQVQEVKGDIQVFASSMIVAMPPEAVAVAPTDALPVIGPQATVTAAALPADARRAGMNSNPEPNASLTPAPLGAQRAMSTMTDVAVQAPFKVQPQATKLPSRSDESFASPTAASSEARPATADDQGSMVARLDPGLPSARDLQLPSGVPNALAQGTMTTTEPNTHSGPSPSTMPMTVRRAGKGITPSTSTSALPVVKLQPQAQHLGAGTQSLASAIVRDEAMPQSDASSAGPPELLAGNSSLATDELATPSAEAAPSPAAQNGELRAEVHPSLQATPLALHRAEQKIPVTETKPSKSSVRIQPHQLEYNGQARSLTEYDQELLESRPPAFPNLAAAPSLTEAPALVHDNLVPPALSSARSTGHAPGSTPNVAPMNSGPAASRAAVAINGGASSGDQATVYLSPVASDSRAWQSASRATPPGFSDSAPVQIQPDQGGIGRDVPTLTDRSPLAGVSDFKLPSDLAPPADPYVQRTPEKRKELVERMGGSEATEQAVELALRWFAAHQADDGRWGARSFDHQCGECNSPAKFDTDIAVTGLALLCFLAADHTHLKDGPYRDNVRKGIDWICSQQQPNGDWRGGESMYSHGIASIAIAETLGMTADPKLRQPVINAIDFICRARNTEIGGWRYEPGQMGDTSVLGWIVMALVSAKSAGITVPDEVFPAASRWLDLVSAQTRPGRYSYQPDQRYSPSMSAEGMYVQHLLGLHRNDPRMLASAEYIHEHPPRWRDAPSTYYWYYATLALYQHQGALWTRWNEMLTEQLLENQNKTGAAAGSWDPVDSWSKIGGRVYQTALCTLSLEVYYRYLPMYHLTDRSTSESMPSREQPR